MNTHPRLYWCAVQALYAAHLWLGISQGVGWALFASIGATWITIAASVVVGLLGTDKALELRSPVPLVAETGFNLVVAAYLASNGWTVTAIGYAVHAVILEWRRRTTP